MDEREAVLEDFAWLLAVVKAFAMESIELSAEILMDLHGRKLDLPTELSDTVAAVKKDFLDSMGAEDNSEPASEEAAANDAQWYVAVVWACRNRGVPVTDELLSTIYEFKKSVPAQRRLEFANIAFSDGIGIEAALAFIVEEARAHATELTRQGVAADD